MHRRALISTRLCPLIFDWLTNVSDPPSGAHFAPSCRTTRVFPQLGTPHSLLERAPSRVTLLFETSRSPHIQIDRCIALERIKTINADKREGAASRYARRWSDQEIRLRGLMKTLLRHQCHWKVRSSRCQRRPDIRSSLVNARGARIADRITRGGSSAGKIRARV